MRRSVTISIASSLIATFAHAQTCTLVRASEAPGGVDPDGASTGCAMTPDSRFVAFSSRGRNLVPNDTNDVEDVFVIELATSAIERVSVATGGGEANSNSSSPSISADGRFVVFASTATNLAALDANGAVDVFVHDRLLGVTSRVSEAFGGGDGDSFSFGMQISGDGRFVVFASYASNLVAGDTNATRDVFLRDVASGVTQRVSVSAAGVEGDAASGGSSMQPAISFDGRFVAFASEATNLVAGDGNGFADVFVLDRSLGTVSRALPPSGVEPDDECSVSSISADGRYVAFISAATNLVANDTNNVHDAFVWDRVGGAIERVSVATNGNEGSLAAWSPVLSPNGRFVAFTSPAPELVASDGNGSRDVFVRDRWGSTTVRASVDAAGFEGLGDSAFPAISNHGDRVAFATGARLSYFDMNDAWDVYVRSCTYGAVFCAGTASTCPCANAAAPDAGCASSLGVGATLRTAGVASVAHDSLTLVASTLPPGTTVRFLQANLPLTPAATLGDGLRCLGGMTSTLGTRAAPAGTAAFGFGIGTDLRLSVLGQVPMNGDLRYYQAWYRNAATFCTAARHNLTNGIEVFWFP